MAEGTETVKSFKSELEAHLARTKLRDVGIEGSVNRFSRYRAMAAGGYQLKVHAKDLARARAILGKLDTEVDMDEYVSSDDASYARCPNCESVNVVADPFPRSVFWPSLLLLGIPLLLMKRDWRCRKCGHGWRE